jgi:hypothetical protein
MTDFWYRLFRTDTNNINQVNTQFSIGPSWSSSLSAPAADTIQRTFTLFSLRADPIGNVLPPFLPSKDEPNCDQAHTETPPTSKRLGLTELQSGLHVFPHTLWALSLHNVQQIADITFINWVGCL